MPEQLRVAGNIPALIWRAAGKSPQPAIISIHGGGGHKGDVEPWMVEYVTSRGVTLVTVDAHLHGDRAPAGFDITAPEHFRELLFLEVIERTAQDLFAVVQHLKADSSIDGSRIGLRGGSMGGYIVLSAVGAGVLSRAVLSVCGAADYANTFKHRLEGEDLDAKRKQEIEERVRQIDPLFQLERFPPRPVLLIHGARDPLVPLTGHRALYDALVPLYTERPEDCLFLTHAGEHPTPRSIEEFGWRWLVNQLFR